MQANETQCVVIGSGPGGYAAAFRAADLGLDVTLVERFPTLGGVCLNVGCIPSKALLHVAQLCEEIEHAGDFGIKVGKPSLQKDKILGFKQGLITKLSTGLSGLAAKRKVKVIQAAAEFASPTQLKLRFANQPDQSLDFKHCIIATGSRPVALPVLPNDPRILDSTAALELPELRGKMLIVGAGIIGCEMATIYQAMGMQVEVVELTAQIMPGADLDLVTPCKKRLEQRGVRFSLETKLTAVEAKSTGLDVCLQDKHSQQSTRQVDWIIQAVGRTPNTESLGLDQAGIALDKSGNIQVDPQSLATNVANIYAIGDVIGGPMLAHKATAQGRVVAQICAGQRVIFDAKVIPAVAYTDPEVAWVGMTEQQCQARGIAYEKGVFPWAASGRSLCYNRQEGLTKILADPETGRIIGAGAVGRHAGDLLAECALAIEMGCVVEDIALTVHPHPTLVETVALSAEVLTGTVTDLYMPKAKSL